MTASVGYSSDPLGLENEEFRSVFYRRETLQTIPTSPTRLMDMNPVGYDDTQLLARTSPEEDLLTSSWFCAMQ